jgi:hypothetical protein
MVEFIELLQKSRGHWALRPMQTSFAIHGGDGTMVG